MQHAQPIVEKLLATARATNLPAGGFGDGFGGDDEDFFGRKPVGLADEGGELFAEARIVVGGVTPFAEFHDDDEGFFLVPCDLRVKEGGSRDGEGGDGALLDLRERVAGVFDVLRVVVLPADLRARLRDLAEDAHSLPSHQRGLGRPGAESAAALRRPSLQRRRRQPHPGFHVSTIRCRRCW